MVVEHRDELGALADADARCIAPAVRATFVDFPRSFRAIAAVTESAYLAGWLHRMAKVGRCTLAIDRPRADLGILPAVEVHLRVGEGDDGVLVTGPIARVPKRLPAPLSEVLRLLGLVRLQYGASGGLVAPSAQRRLLDVYAEIAQSWGMTLEEAAIPQPPAPRTHWTFFDDACGGKMTTNSAGETWRVPMAGGDYVAGPPIDAWLARFFSPGFGWT